MTTRCPTGRRCRPVRWALSHCTSTSPTAGTACTSTHWTTTSHLAYVGKDKICPPTHPVLLPRLRVNVRYPTTGGPTTELASGGQFSGHADFFNVWVPSELRRLVKTCINAGITCDAKA